MIGRGAIPRTMSGVTTFGADRPMNRSRPRRASASVPFLRSGFVSAAIASFSEFMCSRPGTRMPCVSHRITSLTPAFIRSRVTAIPAAPAPFRVTFTLPMSRPVRRRALITPTSTTTAVPCWSSWKIGMSVSTRRRFSISKQRGAAMSSRLTPPRDGWSDFTMAMISSVSCVPRQIGIASMPASVLNRTHFPSMTGSAASGPMFPSPRTAEPSVMTATRFPLVVYSQTLSGVLVIAAVQLERLVGQAARLAREGVVDQSRFPLVDQMPRAILDVVRVDIVRRHAEGYRRVRHRAGDGRADPQVEDARHDTVVPQLLVRDERGDGVGGGDQHLVVDAGGAGVDHPAQDPREGQGDVHPVPIVGAAGQDHRGAGRARLLGADLRVRVGQGEDDRLLAHGPDHLRLH